MSKSNPPVTYQLKIVLVGISPMIWRRIDVSSGLHHCRSALHHSDPHGLERGTSTSIPYSWCTLWHQLLWQGADSWVMFIKSNYLNLASEKEKNSAAFTGFVWLNM